MIPDVDSLPPGYALRELRLTPASVTVVGPLSLVAQISEARAELSLNGRRTSFQQAVPLELLTETGRRVEGLQPAPETILVEAPIEQTFNTREIAVQANLDTNDLGPDLRVTRVIIAPTTVTLTGDRLALEEAGSYLRTAPISLENVSGELEVEVPLILPEGTLAIDGQGDSVTAVVAQVTVEPVISYQVLSLRPTWANLSPTLSITQVEPAEINVLLTGPQPLIEEVRAEPGLVMVSLNLADFDAGSHTIQLAVQAPAGLQVELFPPQVQLVLEKAAD
jgi:YbbR domain-containing protein